MDVPSQFLQLVIDHLAVGLVVVDRSNTILLFNRRAGLMLQEEPEERIGSSLFSCHPRESDKAVETLIEDIKAGAMDHYEGWSNYRGRMLYEYISPMRDASGAYVGMIEELHDAADRAELLRRLGEWKDVHVSGAGERAPRRPEFAHDGDRTNSQASSKLQELLSARSQCLRA